MYISESTPVGEFLGELVRSLPDVLSCEFLEIAVPPSVEFRPGASPRLKELVDETRRMVAEGDSFTETLMRLGAQAGAADVVLEVAQFHQPLAAALRHHRVIPTALEPQLMHQLYAGLRADTMLVFTSKVETKQGPRHIPMADFKLGASPVNNPSAIAAAKRLGPGFLLVSGSSYHYYGHELMSSSQLTEWLLRAQLLSRYVDTRWVTHQLLEGRCALRVSEGGGRYAEPSVLSEV